ncbi:MAG: hypothetical protein CME71_07720 [Halobacteriovorax sp.]|nr:hypothetical protein [Halobacteriovorax sp.]|tara:strand:- start:2741 stop:2965 length:225 start_codon:yes stop_codon:yes gene_type:complete
MRFKKIVTLLFFLSFSLSPLAQDKTAEEEYLESMKTREKMILKAKKAKVELELKIRKYKIEKEKGLELQEDWEK